MSDPVESTSKPKKGMSHFHNVHVHTDLSILDGMGQIQEYATIARNSRMSYLCVTDHHMAAAFPALIESCDKNGIRPVFGVEVYVNNYHDALFSKAKAKTISEEDRKKLRKNNHALLIAYTEEGFANLLKLVSLGWEKGFYYKPRVSFDQIADHSQGLVATSGCLASPVNQELMANNVAGAKDLLRQWSDVFHPDEDGRNRFWIEWQMIKMKEQNYCNKLLLRLQEEFAIPPVITNDVHYSDPDDAHFQKIQLLLSSGGGTLRNPQGLQFDATCLWFVTESQLDERYDESYASKVPLDIYERSKLETLKLCQTCGYVRPDRSPKLPEIPNAKERLRELCLKGLREIREHKNPVYRERLKEEFNLICRKGFPSYFLIQQEMIHAVRHQLNGPVGPGRGSVGGCLIAYLLGIHELDPIKHNLLFSRFLSPSRGGEQMRLDI